MMSDDLASQLHQLHNLRSLSVIGDDTYIAGVATLRSRYGDAAVDALLHQDSSASLGRSHTQIVTGVADIAVAGDVHGNIFLAGQRGKTAAELLEGYLRRVAQRCGRLPLQGVREQKTADDVLQISLEQVYTQLATTALAARERFDGPALAAFDAKAYMAAHVDTRLLPAQQRRTLSRPPTQEDQERRHSATQTALGAHFSIEGTLAAGDLHQSLDQLDADALQKLAGTVDWLVFTGPQLVTEAIAESYRLVLLGEPGSGKSTGLRYLALTLAEAGVDSSVNLANRLTGWKHLGDHGRVVPILLPLLPLARRLAAQPGRAAGADDLWNYIADHLEANGRHAGLAAAIHDELEQGHILLLLDGLDEVAGADSRRQVVDAVRAFAEQYTHCRMVVACRVRAYEGDQNVRWRLPRWPTATLADWSIGQMEFFVAAWYAAAATASALVTEVRDARIQALQRAILARADLQRLGIRPLLLTIMALVHLNDGRLPEDRVTLYSRCIDILLAQWEVRGKDETVYGTLMEFIDMPEATVRSLRTVLEEAAFVAHEASSSGNLGRLGRATLRELVADDLRQRGHSAPWSAAERFLEYTDVRAGLLQASEAGDSYVFPHQTFQEYLAGVKLVSGIGVVERIMERRHDDRWRLPILLGIADHVSGNKLELPYLLLHKLLATKGKLVAEAQRDLLLAAEIGDDVGWDRLERGESAFVELRTNLAQALAQVVEGTTLPAAERVRAGSYLGQIGDPRPGVCTFPPAMVQITTGTFLIGESPAMQLMGDEVNEQPLTLSDYAIARYPVTNAQYALFMADDGYNAKQPWWDTAGHAWLRKARDVAPRDWDNERFGKARPNHPVVNVSWYEAMAFCRWLTQTLIDGYAYSLPTEAEWEYAARGNQRRPYPWGPEDPDDERANFNNRYEGTTAAGCFRGGGTPEGLLDMAGNVWEWTRSVHQAYPYDSDDGRESPDNLAQKRLTLRGGSWVGRSITLRASCRNYGTPDFHYNDVGFRLARHPKV